MTKSPRHSSFGFDSDFWFRISSLATQCLTTKLSCPGTYLVCASQSSSTSGLLYSYGPWCTTGTLTKFPCGGGEVVSFHSSVVAFHGLAGALAPQNQLPRKLTMKKTCDNPRPNAQ